METIVNKPELKPERYGHMTNEDRATLIHLGGRKQRYDNLSDDELIQYYELIFKARSPLTPSR